ncbi:hypothetical protein LPJ61_001055 [Coemansia biformis]|uniref:Uncharacterized protein n=1 Tax=Coemansia biformis TaxID=1286918 RepID=A0A9W7YIH3_9FUNG|nr:hypothetical protein LPJ61_001055 [Coemansia biformis]
MTVGALKLACQEHINKDAKFKPYRHIVFDTLKLYTQAFGNKTQNLIINLESTEFLDDDSAVLEAVGVRSETELSFFNRVDYDRYAENPVTLW